MKVVDVYYTVTETIEVPDEATRIEIEDIAMAHFYEGAQMVCSDMTWEFVEE